MDMDMDCRGCSMLQLQLPHDHTWLRAVGHRSVRSRPVAVSDSQSANTKLSRPPGADFDFGTGLHFMIKCYSYV
jgi:hypothetical protein